MNAISDNESMISQDENLAEVKYQFEEHGQEL